MIYLQFLASFSFSIFPCNISFTKGVACIAVVAVISVCVIIIFRLKQRKKNLTDNDLTTNRHIEVSMPISQIKKQFIESSQNHTQKIDTPSCILASQAYMEILQTINHNHILREDDRLWEALEKAVLESYPDFKNKLILLSGGNLTEADFHITLLIKCGLTPSQMCRLLGRTKGAVSSRRAYLCQKIFGVNYGTKTFDEAIRSL